MLFAGNLAGGFAGGLVIPAIEYLGSKYAEGQAKPSKTTVTVPPVGPDPSAESGLPAGSVPPPDPVLPPPDGNNTPVILEAVL
jgi:hypothetical protein